MSEILYATDFPVRAIRVFLNGEEVTDDCVALKIPDWFSWVELVQRNDDGALLLDGDDVVTHKWYGNVRIEVMRGDCDYPQWPQ